MEVTRLDVFLVNLNPTVGREMRKVRPCVVVSPDELFQHLDTVIIAPLTSRHRAYPTRVSCRFQGKRGQVALDQLRSVDSSRLRRRLGRLDARTGTQLFHVLGQMFAL